MLAAEPPGLLCHILREDRTTYCGYKSPDGSGMCHGGLAVADCIPCLKAAIVAGELKEWLESTSSQFRVVRQMQRHTVSRLRKLGVAPKVIVWPKRKLGSAAAGGGRRRQ